MRQMVIVGSPAVARDWGTVEDWVDSVNVFVDGQVYLCHRLPEPGPNGEAQFQVAGEPRPIGI
jgi:hypothetical protein